MSKGRQPEFARALGANDPEIIKTVLFWVGQGITPRVALQALGIEWTGPEPDWFEVRLAMSAKSRGYYASPVRRAA